MRRDHPPYLSSDKKRVSFLVRLSRTDPMDVRLLIFYDFQDYDLVMSKKYLIFIFIGRNYEGDFLRVWEPFHVLQLAVIFPGGGK
jgi:hypothetical protein